MQKEEWEVSLSRKLTADETARLKAELRPLLDAKAEEEYIGDVIEYSCSMVSNQKSINYVVEEMIGMEFDFLPPTVVETLAEKIQLFMASLPGEAAAAADPNEEDKDGEQAEQAEKKVKSRLVSIKSSAQNALTMSGALGASREGGRNKQTPKEKNKNEGKGGKNRQKDYKKEGEDDKRRDNRGRSSNDDRQPDRGRRDRHGRAFDRLTEDSPHEGRRGQDIRHGPRGGRGGDGPRGRGGRGSGDGRFGGRDGRHGGRGGRGGGRRVAGNRRDRDEFQEEPDFVPAEGPRGGDGGRGRGRGDARGRGRGRGDGRGGRGFEPNKRQRLEDDGGDGGGHYDEYHESFDGGYNDYDYYPPARGGPPRGGGRWGGRSRGRGYRGGGRFGGRGGRGPQDYGSPGGWDNSQEGGGENGGGYDESTEAAAVHPSPIVHANYGAGFRGRGFRGRGRGRSFPGRTHVKNILASKTWVRTKDGDEGDDGQGGQSSEAHHDGGQG